MSVLITGKIFKNLYPKFNPFKVFTNRILYPTNYNLVSNNRDIDFIDENSVIDFKFNLEDTQAFVSNVKLFDDSEIIIRKNNNKIELKTDQLIINNLIPLKNYLENKNLVLDFIKENPILSCHYFNINTFDYDENTQIMILEKDPSMIEKIINPSEKLQLYVINKNPFLIHLMKNPTENVIKQCNELLMKNTLLGDAYLKQFI
jgi:hypothetical protein